MAVLELKRYDVVVAALQETLWFGSAMYHVGERVVLTASSPTPGRGGGSNHSTFWTSNNHMENSRKAVEVIEPLACVYMPADW